MTAPAPHFKAGKHAAKRTAKAPARRRLFTARVAPKDPEVKEKYEKDSAYAFKDALRDTRSRFVLTAGGAAGLVVLGTAVSRLAGALPAGFVNFVNTSYQATVTALSSNPVGQFLVDNASVIGAAAGAAGIAGVVSWRGSRRKADREAIEKDAKVEEARKKAEQEKEQLAQEGINPDEHPLRAAQRIGREAHLQLDVLRDQLRTELNQSGASTAADLDAIRGQLAESEHARAADWSRMEQYVTGLRDYVQEQHGHFQQQLTEQRQHFDQQLTQQREGFEQQLGEQRHGFDQQLAMQRDYYEGTLRLQRPMPPQRAPKPPGRFTRMFRPDKVRAYEARVQQDAVRSRAAQEEAARRQQAAPMPPPQQTGELASGWGPAQGPNYPKLDRSPHAPPAVASNDRQAANQQALDNNPSQRGSRRRR